tara:strand:- start:9 stop:326 length:318 start_codon:yes stop_codon:yes gene_type:complete
MDSLPTLIEPGVKYFIGGTLKECKKFKEQHISLLFNIFLLIGFFIVLAIILFYRYKGKLTYQEIAVKNKQKKEYIISKLQQIAIEKKKQQTNSNLITDLPVWDFR